MVAVFVGVAVAAGGFDPLRALVPSLFSEKSVTQYHLYVEAAL
jgi:hypothetical protein